MTFIIEHGIKSKKMLKEEAKFWNENVLGRKDLLFVNPSAGLFPGQRDWSFSSLPEGEEIVCTNHPRRSWFARVSKLGGKIIIK